MGLLGRRGFWGSAATRAEQSPDGNSEERGVASGGDSPEKRRQSPRRLGTATRNDRDAGDAPAGNCAPAEPRMGSAQASGDVRKEEVHLFAPAWAAGTGAQFPEIGRAHV